MADHIYKSFTLPELTQDVATTSTPDHARKGTRSHPDLVVRWNAYSLTAHTPRSFVTSSSLSLSAASMQAMYSPSPFRESHAPSLAFPEISPPSRGLGGTPFEQQFIGDFPREWSDTNSQISPVSRRDSRSPISLSPVFSSSFRTADDGSDSQDSQGAVERVSLIDKFIFAAAADVEDNAPLSPSPLQDRSSPSLSDISDLTSLSSAEFSDDLGYLIDLQTPPTSQLKESSRSNDQHNERPARLRRRLSTSRSSPCFPDSDLQPAMGSRSKRKRTSASRDGSDRLPARRTKARTSPAPESSITDSDLSLGIPSRRRLPSDVPYNSQFSLLYLRFPVSSYVRLADGKFPLLPTDVKYPVGTYNEPRDALDLYTPRFVRGCGATKVGLCPICIEPSSRGGKGETIWLAMKFSAYNNANASSYHLQYAHGISSVSGLPFSPPVSFRTTKRPNAAKNERTSIQEGKCHKCKKWIFVESIKNMDVKVKELYWWKHAAACHQGTHIDGDDDFFLDDDTYRWVQEAL